MIQVLIIYLYTNNVLAGFKSHYIFLDLKIACEAYNNSQ